MTSGMQPDHAHAHLLSRRTPEPARHPGRLEPDREPMAPGGTRETSKLAINLGTATLGMLILFQDQHAGPFADHKTVAIHIPRSAGGRWVIVAGR